MRINLQETNSSIRGHSNSYQTIEFILRVVKFSWRVRNSHFLKSVSDFSHCLGLGRVGGTKKGSRLFGQSTPSVAWLPPRSRRPRHRGGADLRGYGEHPKQVLVGGLPRFSVFKAALAAAFGFTTCMAQSFVAPQPKGNRPLSVSFAWSLNILFWVQ